jgi:hypothetical protein
MVNKYKNSKRESQFDIFAGLLFHLIFLGQLLMFFVPRGNSAGIGDWMSSVAAAGLVVVGAIQTSSKWRSFPISLKRWTSFAILACAVAIARGFADEDILKTLLESLPFLAIAFFPAIGFPVIPSALIRAWTIHAVIGVLACAFVLITNRSTITAEVVQRSDTLELKSIQFALYSLFFVFFLFLQNGSFVRTIVVVGIVEMAIFAIASGTRQAVVLLSGVILIGLWNIARVNAINADLLTLKSSLTGKKIAPIILVCSILALGGYFIAKQMSGGINLFASRMQTDRKGTSIVDNDRWIEVRSLIEQFAFEDFLLGRGVRGSFQNDAAPKQDNVHIGWFRVLLKAGVVMICLLIIGPVATGVRTFMRAKHPLVLSCAGMCCYFTVKNSTGNIVMAYPVFYLVMICFGTCAGFCWSKRSISRQRFVSPNALNRFQGAD